MICDDNNFHIHVHEAIVIHLVQDTKPNSYLTGPHIAR